MLNLDTIRALESQRDSKVLVLAASQLDIELMPALYNCLRQLGHVERLDVVLYSRGGIVNGVRRIALLLREFCHTLTFIVPHYCESSATLLCLSGHEIIAGPLAVFSPIDPALHSAEPNNGNTPSSLSSQDVRLFSQMMKEWFELDDDEARAQSASHLCSSIFPTTLTSFYRSTLELQQIGEQLLAFQLPEQEPGLRTKIVAQLQYGYHSHTYAITREEMTQLGLKIRQDPRLEVRAWELAEQIRANLGPGACQSLDDGWFDAIIATAHDVNGRWCHPERPSPCWKIVR
ncbi:hypothetical protein [Shewanella sp. CG12_big_fil_rev_8_21_14_0_65_47_15]|uniref:SDH family Clp fold serine proteinase n=1 Tax=Shewanella sp. CG12_big_fil_rev_8_21_14_0_65_47_15 TaxID=1975537 RepID=UPI000CB08777|nr:hypothetical protein [Shewanella sp. CG12_big_fil_rev_8_21_14_0_65_47_15]PIW61590.1 MAG: hypothetical protein COW15_07645 [Shewanella sp. CG12_big_fil_rev_8_21_14_0_65_47_15]